MNTASTAKAVALVVAMNVGQTACLGQPLINADFSKKDFAALGWKVKGAWDVFSYPKEAANNPGLVARFPARKPHISRSRTASAEDS